MTTQLRTVIPVWVASALAAVFIALATPADQYLQWLPIAMAAALLLTFCIQLAIVQKEGLVHRVMLSAVGAILILGAATFILGLASAW